MCIYSIYIQYHILLCTYNIIYIYSYSDSNFYVFTEIKLLFYFVFIGLLFDLS